MKCLPPYPVTKEVPALAAFTAAPQREGERRRVLVVEDNRDAVQLLRMLLEMLGHEVRVAYTGTDGLRAASEWCPDLILCDIGLPGLDGWALARAVRRDPRTARARLIAITGYGQEADRRRSQEAGFDYHFTKPVDPHVLERLLAEPLT